MPEPRKLGGYLAPIFAFGPLSGSLDKVPERAVVVLGEK
jgi:hypothetical protein